MSGITILCLQEMCAGILGISTMHKNKTRKILLIVHLITLRYGQPKSYGSGHMLLIENGHENIIVGLPSWHFTRGGKGGSWELLGFVILMSWFSDKTDASGSDAMFLEGLYAWGYVKLLPSK